MLKRANEIRFFRPPECQTSTMILSVGIKYSIPEIFCDIDYCWWATQLQYQ